MSDAGTRVPRAVIPMHEKRTDLEESQIEPKRVDGGNLPAAVHDLNRPLNEEDKPFVVPTGPEPEEPAE
jgi:hypothetical protein